MPLCDALIEIAEVGIYINFQVIARLELSPGDHFFRFNSIEPGLSSRVEIIGVSLRSGVAPVKASAIPILL